MEFYISNFFGTSSVDLANILINSDSNNLIISGKSFLLPGQYHETSCSRKDVTNKLNSGNTTRLVSHNTQGLRTPQNSVSIF